MPSETTLEKRKHSTLTMRTILLTTLVVYCAIIGISLGQSFIPGGYTPVDPGKWPEISTKITNHLVILKNKQGHTFKLVQIQSMESQLVAGFKYIGTAEFENVNGTIINCGFSLIMGMTDYENLQMNCGVNEIYTR